LKCSTEFGEELTLERQNGSRRAVRKTIYWENRVSAIPVSLRTLGSKGAMARDFVAQFVSMVLVH
jgi:hypothetical protein